MADSAPSSRTDPSKRHSTRIVQAVPLGVTGVDALGRPFQERTSTSIINCHGCRYQSKHYVLKNMWVTLEVPHPEQGNPPRSVRARVMWIQRPRTVRELFQVGAELEVPGNLWGIAFSPPDWFPFPESGRPEIPAPPAETQRQERETAEEAWTVAPEPAQAPAEDNLRTIPITGPTGGPTGPGTEPALALARQMARLVNEAKQQLHAAIRESAAEAVSAETRPLLAALQNQMRDAAERSVEAAATTAAEQAVRGALGKTELEAEARLRRLLEGWNTDVSRNIEQANQKVIERLGEVAEERRSAFEQQLEARIQQALAQLQAGTGDFSANLEQAREQIETFRQQAESSTATVLQEATSQLQAKGEDARARLVEVESAIRQLNERIEAASLSAESGWKTRLDADLAGAGSRWDERVENSLESAARRAAERLANTAQAAGEQFETDMRSRIAAIGNTLTDATAEAESRLAAARTGFENQAGHAREVLTQVQSVAQGVAEQAAKLEALNRAAQEEMERRTAALVEVQSQELTRRAENALAAWTDRLQPSLEAAGQETVVRLGAQLEQRLNSQLDRASEALGRLENVSLAAEEAQRKREAALAKASDGIVEAAIGQLQKQLDRLGHNFQEAGREATAKWIAEIDGKATEITHTTFESLFKTSEWYEKKVQTQMQATLEKGLEQAGSNLREKAGEISGLFASELDHYSRNYVEHARGQLEEDAREALERVRKQSAEMAAASVSSLARQMQDQTETALGGFGTRVADALRKVSAQMEGQAGQTCAKIAADGQRFAAEFRTELARESQQATGNARQQLAAQVDLARDNLHIESQEREKRLRETLAALGDRGIEAYKQRLESAANSWLLTTVTKLHQQSEHQLETLAQSTEERLHETCKQVFAGVGETLRQRMLDLGTKTSGDKTA